MSLQTSASRLIQRQLRQLASVKPVAGPSSCLCTCSTATSWASRSRWQSTRSQSTSTAGSNVEEQVPSPEDHDIVIVGGGLVGLALANALSTSRIVQSAGTKVSLLEGSDLDKVANWSLPPGKWSNRISSITNESQRFLTDTGGWQHLDTSRTRACEEMRVWDGLSGARIDFAAWDVSSAANSGAPEMSRFVENIHLQKALLTNLKEQNNVEIIDKTRVQEIVQGNLKSQGGWPVVKLDNGRSIRARLLVGADGANSPVKNYSGIKTDGWAYDAHCLVGTLELEPSPLDTNTIAWQRFLPVGPVGFLPIADTYGSLAWSTKPHIAAALKKLDAERLTALINASFRLPWSSLQWLYQRLETSPETLLEDIAWRYSPANLDRATLPFEHSQVPPIVKTVHLDTCASFPLKLSHAQSYLGDTDVGGLPKRTVLIGDAAHTVHPMAGQGLNLGLGDATSLFETLESAIAEGADIGSKLSLNPYPRQRYLINHTIMNVIDKLHKLYAQEAKPIVWARSTGVEILNQLPALKGIMMGGAGAKTDKSSNTRQNVWGGVAKAYDMASGARDLGGMLGRMAKSRIASAMSK